MKFRTEVQIPDYSWEISYKSSAIFMGSCFTENIGQKMADLKYQVDINPFGILYNPVSVASGIRFLLQAKTFQ
ncbi:MAG TPA: GSCFA domain-containing protein, partial [Draconibacterium sp.]|nr:GSCFA domain-containing protein [Draconibacterium sp.]